jgi:hypothetical protein
MGNDAGFPLKALPFKIPLKDEDIGYWMGSFGAMTISQATVP